MRTPSPAAGGIGPSGSHPGHRRRTRPAGVPVPVPMPAPASHRDLLAMALRIQRAAAADDRAAVHRDLRRFRTALDEHVRAEEDDLDRLAQPARQIVLEGQERLGALVDDMLAGTGACASGCSCLVRTAELRTALGRQARLESGLLAGPTRARATRGRTRRTRRRP